MKHLVYTDKQVHIHARMVFQDSATTYEREATVKSCMKQTINDLMIKDDLQSLISTEALVIQMRRA